MHISRLLLACSDQNLLGPTRSGEASDHQFPEMSIDGARYHTPFVVDFAPQRLVQSIRIQKQMCWALDGLSIGFSYINSMHEEICKFDQARSVSICWVSKLILEIFLKNRYKPIILRIDDVKNEIRLNWSMQRINWSTRMADGGFRQYKRRNPFRFDRCARNSRNDRPLIIITVTTRRADKHASHVIAVHPWAWSH